MNEQCDRPDWWEENIDIKSSLGLPAYTPPRFEDGRYTHEITQKLEDEFSLEIEFVGLDTRYPDDWRVTLNDDTSFPIGRYRDKNGNTVYECTSVEFEAKVREIVDR